MLATMRICARSHGTGGLKRLPSRKAEKMAGRRMKGWKGGAVCKGLDGALMGK